MVLGSSARDGDDAAAALARCDAVIFDLDGVITDTASVHEAAWKRTFDAYLREREGSSGELPEPFTDTDYRRYVDGMPRYDGVRNFLRSRGISLPEGDPADRPERETVCGIGNRKNAEYLRVLAEGGAVAFPSSIGLLGDLIEAGVPRAIISASRNCAEVLRAVGAEEFFEARVDGVEAERLGLAGKPDPAVFLEAARRLAVEPRQAAIVEDAVAGVEAGRSGGFGLVVGVARSENRAELAEAGADVVVDDLAELRAQPAGGGDG